jgi:CRP-like cAMP-binding protein
VHSKSHGMEHLLETKKKILASAIPIKYLEDEFLFRQGQKAEFVFYLQSGSVSLNLPNEITGLIVLDQPIFIGIEEAFQEGNYACTALTIEISEFLVFDRPYFMQLITEFDLAKEYFDTMKLDFSSQVNLQKSRN